MRLSVFAHVVTVTDSCTGEVAYSTVAYSPLASLRQFEGATARAASAGPVRWARL